MDRRRFLQVSTGASAAAAGSVVLASPAEAAPRPRPGRVLARGLSVPWGLAFLPNGNALVAERTTGRVYRVRAAGGKRLVGEIDRVADSAGEGGLLGLATAPTFAEDRWLYAYLSTGTENQIVRMPYRNQELGTVELLLDGIPVASFHNGGRLAFGPGGLLFASTGDAGDVNAAQDLDSLAGKILRLRPDGSVPNSNPFGSHVYSYGHRNVQGLAWDGRGRMWASELGQNVRDELNRIRRGRNYGWPDVEGGDGPGPFADPFVTWPTSRCSPSGLAVTRGRAWVGALRGECLWSVRLFGRHAGRKQRHLFQRFGRIRTVEAAPDGSLWITTSNQDGRGNPAPNDDRVIRIRL